jgi:hypothetical protein
MAKSLHVEATMFYLPVKQLFKKQIGFGNSISALLADPSRENNIEMDALKGISYHTILQQKVEHILELNNFLIQDLKQSLNNEKLTNGRFLPILGMLVKLHISQLELVFLEFSESKNRILKSIHQLDADDNKFAGSANKILSIIAGLIQKFKDVVIFSIVSDKRYVRKDLHHIESVYTLTSERILLYKLFMMGGEEVLPDNLEDLTIEIF